MGEQTKKKKKAEELIDKRRATNILISKSQLKLNDDEIIRSIMMMDMKLITEDKCTMLLKCTPNEEEIPQLKSIEPGTKVGPGTSFMLQLFEIPRISVRLNLWLSVFQFEENMADIVSQLNCCEEAQKQLQTSKNLHQFMQLVLDIGNHLNYGRPKGGAKGFRVSDFSLLRGTKSYDKKTTLLDFLIISIRNSEEHSCIRNFVKDLEILKKAQDVEESYIEGEITKLTKLCNDMRREKKQNEKENKKKKEDMERKKKEQKGNEKDIEEENDIVDMFCSTIDKFLEINEVKIKKSKSRLEVIQATHKDLVVLFGEKKKTTPE